MNEFCFHAYVVEVYMADVIAGNADEARDFAENQLYQDELIDYGEVVSRRVTIGERVECP